MSHVMADLGAVPFTKPEPVSQVCPAIQPQYVMPWTEAVFQKTGNKACNTDSWVESLDSGMSNSVM